MTKELAARNVIGIMLGATPPTLGNLQGIVYDWLHERTLWRHQAALRRAAGDRPADYAAAKAALLQTLSASKCKRRAEERRVGKECVRTRRSRRSPYHETKHTHENRQVQ